MHIEEKTTRKLHVFQLQAPKKAKKVSEKKSRRPVAQENDECECVTCGISYYGEDHGDWIECRQCRRWYHMMCEGVDEEEALSFICSVCFY